MIIISMALVGSVGIYQLEIISGLQYMYVQLWFIDLIFQGACCDEMCLRYDCIVERVFVWVACN